MFQRSSSHLIKLQLRGVWWRDTKEKETGEPAGELRVEDPAIFLLWREDPTAFHAVLSSTDIQTTPMTCLAHDLNGDRMCSKLTQCMLVKNKAGLAVVYCCLVYVSLTHKLKLSQRKKTYLRKKSLHKIQLEGIFIVAFVWGRVQPILWFHPCIGGPGI